MYAVTMESYDDRPFDVLAYLKTPRVIVRLLSLIFSAIVFGCISDSVDTGYVAKMGDLVYASCAYHGDNRVCNYGVATGVIAFVGSVVFLIVDAFYEFLGAAFKKNSTFADLVFSAFWTLMWFVGFCYLADRWRVTRDPSPGSPLTTKVKNNARAAVAFSFFSVVAWVILTVFAINRIRRIIAGDYGGGYHAPSGSASRGAGYGEIGSGDSSQAYQGPPLSGDSQKTTDADY